MKLEPTKEQQEIISSAMMGNNLAINAFAGAAKTTTCVLISEKIKKLSLYVCFNKAVANEAGEKFPFHVDCRTLHSLAYENIIKPNYKFKNKLQNWLNKDDIDLGYLENSPTAFKLKQTIVNAITLFCQSSYSNFDELIDTYEEFQGFHQYLVEYWDKLTDLNDKAKITHDVYLKMFQLSDPILDYSVIYLDEFQDSNPVIMSIVFGQLKYDTQVIVVGDKYQSIYEWRGAVNGFNTINTMTRTLLIHNMDSNQSDTLEWEEEIELPIFKTFYLTESFRFTQSIANLASKLLYIAGEDKTIIGRNSPELPERELSKSYICRTNATLLSYLLDAESKGQKVYCLTDLKDLWSKLYHISNLYFGNVNKFPNAELARFKDYKQLKAEAEHDDSLNRLMKLTISMSAAPGLHANINKIKSVLVDNPIEADYTLTTAHKSKGLEWDVVYLAEDMFYLKDEQTIEESLAENQTLNLLYVALTRAKYTVNVPLFISELLVRNKEYREEYLNLIGE